MFRYEAKISTEVVKAEVRTDFRRAILGSVSGFSFSAELESESGRSSVEYIVRDIDLAEVDLDEGFWMDFNPAMAAVAMNN